MTIIPVPSGSRLPLTATPTTTAGSGDDHVRVQFPAGWLFHKDLGLAPRAATSSTLTLQERQAVLDIDRAARALGLVGSGRPDIVVSMRDRTANYAGPYASGNRVGVPTTNLIGEVSRQMPNGEGTLPTDVLYPFDVALHEMAHVVQGQTMQSAGVGGLEQRTRAGFIEGLVNVTSRSSAEPARQLMTSQEAVALREGLSDAASAVVTHDWVLGEEYYAPGSAIRAVRDVSNPHTDDVLGTIETDYSHARAGLDGTAPATREVDGVTVRDDEGHSVGGVISRAVYEFQQKRGWDEATTLVEMLQHDEALWTQGGTLESFRDRFLADARAINQDHPGALAAARDALRAVGYTVSPEARGSSAPAPEVTSPADPGYRQAGEADHDDRDPQLVLHTAIGAAKGGGIGGAIGGVLGLFANGHWKIGATLGAMAGAAIGGGHAYIVGR